MKTRKFVLNTTYYIRFQYRVRTLVGTTSMIISENSAKLSPVKVGMSVIAKKRMSCKKTKMKQLTVIEEIVG